jgi:hypothetical protein
MSDQDETARESTLNQRLLEEEQNVAVYRDNFPDEYGDLDSFNRALWELPAHIAPLDNDQWRLAAMLYQMAGEALLSASAILVRGHGHETLMFVRKAVEATAIGRLVASDKKAFRLYVERTKKQKKKNSGAFSKKFRRSNLFPQGSSIRDDLLEAYDMSSEVGVHANFEGFVGRARTAEDNGVRRDVYDIYLTDTVWMSRYTMLLLRAVVGVYKNTAETFRDKLRSEGEVARTRKQLEERRALANQRHDERRGKSDPSPS